jgi:hypothetical protein
MIHISHLKLYLRRIDYYKNFIFDSLTSKQKEARGGKEEIL